MSLKNAVKLAAQEKLRKHEKTVEEGLLSFVEVGKALGMIRLEKLYALAGHADFDTYVEQRFTISPRHADRLISAARVVLLLGPIGRLIKNESTARELAVFGRNETDKMQKVVEAATTDGRVTAAAVRAVRDELYPEYRTIEGQFREGGRLEIEPAAKHCESCPAEVPWSDWTAGQLRCRSCDPSSLHRATAPGGEFTDECAECARIASQTAAGEGTPPADAGITRPAAGSGDASPVAGSGLPQTAAGARNASPADGVEASSTVRADDTPAGPEPVRFGLGSGNPPDSPAAATSLTSPHAGVPAVGDQTEERTEEEAVEPPADTPAAAATSLPDGDGHPKPEPSQQPGHNSPTGIEGSRSETDHHEPGGEPGSGEAPGSPVPVEPELEGGGEASLSSPSSEPDALVALFKDFAEKLDRIDVEVVAPLLLSMDVDFIEEYLDQISTFVGLIEKWRLKDRP